MLYLLLISLMYNVSLLNAVIIENNSDYVIYAIKEKLETYTDEDNRKKNRIVESNFIDVFLNGTPRINPKQTKKIAGDNLLMVYIPMLHTQRIHEFRYIDIKNLPKKKKSPIQITNDLILDQHLSNSIW